MDSQAAQQYDSPVPTRGIRAPNNSPAEGVPSGPQAHPEQLNRALESTLYTPRRNRNNHGIYSGNVETLYTARRHSRGFVDPLMTPTRPRNNSQSHANDMINAFFPNQSRYRPRGNSSYSQNLRDQQPGSGQRQGQLSRPQTFLSRGPQNNGDQEFSLAEEHAHIQRCLFNLAEIVSQEPGISRLLSASITTELRDLSDRQTGLREYQLEERRRFSNVLASNRTSIQNAMTERDRAYMERNQIQAQFDAIQQRVQELEQKLEQAESDNKKKIDYLNKQCRFKDEQINAKRSLWVENQERKNPGANPPQGMQDPSTTPHHRHDSRAGAGFQEPHVTPGPSRPRRATTCLDADKLKSPKKSEYWPYQVLEDDTPTLSSGHASSEEDSFAMVPFKTEDEMAQDFHERFDDIYQWIDAWVQAFAADVDFDLASDKKVTKSADIWRFLMTCISGNFSDPSTHAFLLLRNPATRAFFVTRVIIQYLHGFMWKATAFGGVTGFDGVEKYTNKCKAKLDNIESKLKVKGLDPAQRAHLVNIQTRLVRRIARRDDYAEFRRHCLEVHCENLRVILGPILNAACVRRQAGRGLAQIATRAWDLSAHLYTSNYTILFVFPACNDKYQHPSMMCDDPMVNETSLELQIRQARIKLLIKPIITMRNDRNMKISVKKVETGHVLIFP